MPFALAGAHTSLWLLGAVLLIRGFGIGAVLIPPMSVAYQDIPVAGIPHATMNTRIAQQVGASFGIAIVAVALQSRLAHGAASAFRARSGGRSASRSPRSSPPSPSPPRSARLTPSRFRRQAMSAKVASAERIRLWARTRTRQRAGQGRPAAAAPSWRSDPRRRMGAADR